VYVYTCICIYMGVHFCVYVHVCKSVFMFTFICMIAWYSDTDPFSEIETRCRRFIIVFVINLIHWRFEDLPMRWSGDPYRFMQWRPYGDSDPKSRHFMGVFVLMLFTYCCQ